jgi:hypothetical protein
MEFGASDFSLETNKVELPLIEHIFIIQHFPIFFGFCSQIEWFLCHWMCKLQGYKYTWSVSKVKEQHQKKKLEEKGCVTICFNILGKIALDLDPLLIPVSYLVHF